MATVEELYLSEKASAPMERRDKLELMVGLGIVGDRYASGKGTYSKFPEVGRQLTIISADGVEGAIAAGGGLPGAPPVGSLRRSVIVRGISAEELNMAVGCEMQLGSCRVFVHRLCVPCKYNERLNNCPGMMEHLWDVSGVNCEILEGGELAVGNSVRVIEGSRDMGRISHGKPAEFFVRPSLRRATKQAVASQADANHVPAGQPRKAELRERRRVRGEELSRGTVSADGAEEEPPARIASPAFMALLAVMTAFFVAAVILGSS